MGGGNSAGQAAVFLAQTANRVHLLVRAGGLADSMSRYLIRRIEENPRIVLRAKTEIVALEGTDHLERVRWRSRLSAEESTLDIRNLFLFAGADPATGPAADRDPAVVRRTKVVEPLAPVRDPHL